MSAKSSAILAVGRRKTASARVRLSRGTGSIVVNGKPVEEYLYTEALVKSATLRAPLKKEGLLTRDGRMRERKKPGRPGARKRFQFSKR